MSKSPHSAPLKAAPKNRIAELSHARKAAFHILLAVERGQSHSDDLLRGRAVDALSAPDRNLATALVLGVLRWQIQLDRQLQSLLKHPNAKLDAEIRIALRLGAFQILHMDRIPARAAIDESVELAKQAGHRFASGMVNAVLRKLAAGIEKKISGFDPGAGLAEKGTGFSPYIHPTQEAGASAPEGMRSEPAALAGFGAARDLCRHGQTQPALTIRLASPAVESELVAAGIALEPGQLLTCARTVVSGDVTATAAFREGRVRLQDEGSQLVAELAATTPDQKVKNIGDVCAAPGGKTLILAERNPQARILACEASPQRLEQLRHRLAPLADRIECRLADATQLAADSAFDLALADVPCSGTGTLGRNPEIRHRLRPEDLTRQAERQRALLTAALRAVRPGGRVVYSTCSLEPEENEQVLAAALAANPSARALSLGASIESLLDKSILTPAAERLQASLTTEGALRLLPGAFHTDGFFIALLERSA
jgi:16S rRNA (cytosine967-C5)-methyltransferase